MLKINHKPVIKSFGEAAFENILDKDSGKHKVHEKPEMRAVMIDIINAVMLYTEYEAGVKVHRDSNLNMDEKPGPRDGMLKTNPKGKYDENVNVDNVMEEKPEARELMHDEANVVRKRGNVRQDQVDQLNIYVKPETRAGMVDIFDAVMLNIEYEADVMVHRGRELNMSEKPETRDGRPTPRVSPTRT
jgi:hypothetical protein